MNSQKLADQKTGGSCLQWAPQKCPPALLLPHPPGEIWISKKDRGDTTLQLGYAMFVSILSSHLERILTRRSSSLSSRRARLVGEGESSSGRREREDAAGELTGVNILKSTKTSHKDFKFRNKTRALEKLSLYPVSIRHGTETDENVRYSRLDDDA